jgi:hypothetical protein
MNMSGIFNDWLKFGNNFGTILVQMKLTIEGSNENKKYYTVRTFLKIQKKNRRKRKN